MKIIIAGGRHFTPKPQYEEWLNSLAASQTARGDPITEVISGGARGADQFGEEWAAKNRIYVKRFPADWTTHGRRAGPIRNAEMAEYLQLESLMGIKVAVVLFPGGRGTQDMFNQAEKRNLKIYRFTTGESEFGNL